METAYDVIRGRVTDKMVTLNPNNGWLSLNHAQELLHGLDIEAALRHKLDRTGRKGSIWNLAKFVKGDATVLFVMLIYLGKLEMLEEFYNKDIGDSMFPLEVQLERDYAIIKGNKPRRFDFGTQIQFPDAQTLFNHNQWDFYVPKLGWTAFEDADFNQKCRLPFLTLPEPEKPNGAGFSIVSKTIIHRDYITIDMEGIVSARLVSKARLYRGKPRSSWS